MGARRSLVIGCIAGAMMLMPAYPAEAHGPCHCTEPREIGAGGWISISTRTKDVVWNPRDGDFRIDRPLQLRHYTPVVSEPTQTLLMNQSPESGARIQTPDAAPGRYLVLIYDGSENDQHYTWDYVNVTSRAEPAAGASLVWAYAIGVVLILGIAAIVITLRARRTA